MSKYQNYIAVPEAVWFKSLPDTWKAVKMRALFSERVTKVSDKDYPPLSVGYIGVVPQLANAAKTDNGDNRKLIKAGDFAINSRSDRKGAGGISKYDGSCSIIITVLKPHSEINGTFYHYLLRSHYFSEEFYRNGNGIVGDLWTTKWKTMRNIYVTVPPREEQDQIVRFLDWKVSKINKLISLKRRRIAYLEELQRSRTAHLIMGNSRDIAQRKTCIGWVESIPVHWREKTLIQFADEQQIKNTGMKETNLLSLSYGEIVKKDINTTEGLLPVNFEGYQIVYPGSIILRLTDLRNDHKSLRTGLVTQTGIITSAYVCLKARDGIIPEYLQLQLHVADLCKVFYGMGGGVRQSIGFKDIRKLLIAIPPIDDQQHIIELVHRRNRLITRAIQVDREFISTLEALKTRLISDVVTGKLDVQNIEIPDFEYTYADVGSS